VVEDLKKILVAATPSYVYLHNPADKHDTHVGTMMRAIAALRAVRTCYNDESASCAMRRTKSKTMDCISLA